MNVRSTHARASFRFPATAGGTLLLRLTVHSRLPVPAVIEAVVDDWVGEDGSIHPARRQATPAHSYLRPSERVHITVSCAIPVTTSRTLRSILRFPGLDDTVLPLQVELTEAGEEPGISEHLLTLTLPVPGCSTEQATATASTDTAVMKLLGGLTGLETIPARWLAAELLLGVCEMGEEYSHTAEGDAMLTRLRRTRFYKNGALALRGAYLVEWLQLNVTVSSGLHQALGGAPGQGRMLDNWLRWLLGLVDTDIERFEEEVRVQLASRPVEQTLSSMGNEAERWFGALVLGLSRLSPRFKAVLEQIIEDVRISALDIDDGDVPRDILSEPGSLQR
jgi:hypothetical protein